MDLTTAGELTERRSIRISPWEGKCEHRQQRDHVGRYRCWGVITSELKNSAFHLVLWHFDIARCLEACSLVALLPIKTRTNRTSQGICTELLSLATPTQTSLQAAPNLISAKRLTQDAQFEYLARSKKDLKMPDRNANLDH